jgi:hypothetical protein
MKNIIRISLVLLTSLNTFGSQDGLTLRSTPELPVREGIVLKPSLTLTMPSEISYCYLSNGALSPADGRIQTITLSQESNRVRFNDGSGKPPINGTYSIENNEVTLALQLENQTIVKRLVLNDKHVLSVISPLGEVLQEFKAENCQ